MPPERGERRHLQISLDPSGAPIGVALVVNDAEPVPLTRPHVILGRRPPPEHVAVQDAKIGRHQCELVFDERGLGVRDLGSACGTFVNGRRIRELVALCEGDVILIGDSTLRIVHR